MADQKKSVAEIIEEMRRELRDEKGPDSDLFVSTLTRETRDKLRGKAKKKAATGKTVKRKKGAKKKAGKRRPTKKAKKKGKKPAKKAKKKGKPKKSAKKKAGKKPAKKGKKKKR